jgi:phosphoserine phosphatase
LFVRGFTPPLRLADYKLVAFDMDSTLINIECIDEIAQAVGRKAEVAAITEAAMRGEVHRLPLQPAPPPGAAARRALVSAGAGLRAAPAASTPGSSLRAACREAGLKTLLISGGFTFFSERVRQRLKLDFARANELDVVDGHLTGALVPRPWGDVVDGPEKRRVLLEVAELMGISPAQTIAVGDGANDLPMMAVAGLSIAYHPKPAVLEQAMLSITEGGMDRALQLLQR